jgi:dTDP-4-dehydrorhamnose reductase
VYGKSKLEGEKELFANARSAVVRTAWLYGNGGRNFVDTILLALDERGNLEVVNDQVGSPTYVADLSGALAALLQGRAEGLYHVANQGEASWFDLAREAARLTGRMPERIRPATTAEVPRPAKRPAHSVLDCRRVAKEHGIALRPWREALADYLAGRRPQTEGEPR